MIEQLERFVFRYRGAVLVALAAFTVWMGVAATGIRLATGVETHLPAGHPYVETFLEYRDQMTGVNRVVLALRTTEGDIWNPRFFRKLSEATDALAFLPGIDRRTVTSLWTPNIRSIEITEEGMRAEDMIGDDVTLETLTQEDVERTRERVLASGLLGRLVSRDFTTAMVVAEALDVDVDSAQEGGVLDLAERLETEVRQKLQGEGYDVHIIGFVPMVGQIAEGARSVVVFFAVALLLTSLAVYAYSRSWILTALPLGCSLVSAVWQFGTMVLLDYAIDPMAILVPFLVFAVGVSHGIQQINLVASRVAAGDDGDVAGRSAFRGLLVPGSMALVTDGIAFATLLWIPIPMIQDLGASAAIGIGYKIVSNLVLLPLLVSYVRFDGGFVERNQRSQDLARRVMGALGRLADHGPAALTLTAFTVLLAVAAVQAQGRHVGELHEGSTELRPDSLYNRDARRIVEKFDLGLDLLTVLAETGEGACIDYETLHYLDRFSWHMTNVPGVTSLMSTPVIGRYVQAAWNEGRLEWRELPRNRWALMQVTSSIPSGLGVYNEDCTVMPVQVFTQDHRAETIAGVVASAEAFIDAHPSERVRLRMASGNVGIQAATDEVLERSELPMMLWAYASIVLVVLVTYRDWRAIPCCAFPLCLATFLGYWFMKEREIGLKVSTLPVMVLAVGIGVDYAFYIYSRVDHHLRAGADVASACRQALFETGNAVVFTGVTLAVGVSTWAFSPLQFQADMGLLLGFMFSVNMLGAVTVLPALAVVLHGVFPRRAPEGVESCAGK
jgi:predicted RND superfamily exporter protein